MPPERKSSRSFLRQCLRRGRIIAYALLLILGACFLYLNRVGVPDFVKARLQAELRDHGVDLQFERLRLRLYHGFVADLVTLGRANQPDTGPQFHLSEVTIKLDLLALLRFKLKVVAVGLQHGRVTIPLDEPGQPPLQCALEQISATLRFLPRDCWELEHLEASLLGTRIRVFGTVTNATALREWRLGPVTQVATTGPPPWKPQLRNFVLLCKQTRFAAPPELRFGFRGDARQPSSFAAVLKCSAKGAETPWGEVAGVQATASLNAWPATNGVFTTSLLLNIDKALTRWAQLETARLEARVARAATNPIPIGVDLDLSARQVKAGRITFSSAQWNSTSTALDQAAGLWMTKGRLAAGEARTPWGYALSNRLSANFTLSLPQKAPISGDAGFEAGPMFTEWCDARSLAILGGFNRASNALEDVRADSDLWRVLGPYCLRWTAKAQDLNSHQVDVTSLGLEGSWKAPTLSLTNMHAVLYGGSIDGREAHFDTSTREIDARVASRFDFRKLGPCLGSSAKGLLDQLTWETPPELKAAARLVLPASTNSQQNWKQAVSPTLVVEAKLNGDNLGFRGVQVSSLAGSILYSNCVLSLPSLVISRPEGQVEAEAALDHKERAYFGRIASRINLKALEPAFGPEAHRGFKLVEFGEPPWVDLQFRGSLDVLDRIGAAASVAATNFSIHGQACDGMSASVLFTNMHLVARDVKARKGDEWIETSGMGIDFINNWLFLTNARSRMDPMRIARAIGPNVARVVEPYRFDQPPHARVQGRIPVHRGKTDGDVLFELNGGSFHWWKFNLPHVRANIRWVGESVIVTNLDAGFYGGRLTGDLAADTGRPDPTFSFHAWTTNTDLHLLLCDVNNPTNRIEGVVSGSLAVTSANSADWTSWYGFGQASMRNGLLWDLPLFGMFSPVLNSIVPGLGSSRAKAATGAFTIEKSVIRTRKLEIVSPPIRLRYNGTVDFQGNVQARVEAVILRGTPLIGPLISLAFAPLTKILEYKVSGTLGNPQSEPVYIPKFIGSLIHPLRTLREIFGEPSPSDTPIESDAPPQ